jgi:hypothetical protein
MNNNTPPYFKILCKTKQKTKTKNTAFRGSDIEQSSNSTRLLRL